MSPGLRYTAAPSARVTKRNVVKNAMKNHQKSLRNILPSQRKYKQNLNKLEKAPNIKEKHLKEAPLKVEDYNVELDYKLLKNDDLVVAIDTITNNQWSECCSLTERYAAHSDQAELSNHDKLFQIKGISLKTKAEIEKFRSNLMPNGLVTINQLYSMYQELGNTFVDKKVELEMRKGRVRKFIISNASPVILRSPQKFQKGKVTYGYEDVEIIVKSKTYSDTIERSLCVLEDSPRKYESPDILVKVQALKHFYDFVKKNPSSLFVDSSQGFSNEELSSLVSLGFLTLNSNHLNEIELHQYSISFPNCGTFLKLITSGRVWLVKALSKSKFKEALEESMFNLWDGLNNLNANGISKWPNYSKPYYGYDLHWILADALGAGIVEVFNTPTGRGWRLTGKV